MPKHIDVRETRHRKEMRQAKRLDIATLAIDVLMALPGFVYALVQLANLLFG